MRTTTLWSRTWKGCRMSKKWLGPWETGQGSWSGRQGNVSRHYYNKWNIIFNLQTAWFYFTSALLHIAEKMWCALMLHFPLTSPVENNFSLISPLSFLLIDIHSSWGGGSLSWYAFYSIFLHSSLTFSSPSSNSCLSCFLTSVSRLVHCSLSGDLSYITDLYLKCSSNFPLPDFFSWSPPKWISNFHPYYFIYTFNPGANFVLN